MYQHFVMFSLFMLIFRYLSTWNYIQSFANYDIFIVIFCLKKYYLLWKKRKLNYNDYKSKKIHVFFYPNSLECNNILDWIFVCGKVVCKTWWIIQWCPTWNEFSLQESITYSYLPERNRKDIFRMFGLFGEHPKLESWGNFLSCELLKAKGLSNRKKKCMLALEKMVF